MEQTYDIWDTQKEYNLEKYNESVWIPEIVDGLKKHITENILIRNKPVNVLWRQEDADIRKDSWPGVLIQQLYEIYEPFRNLPANERADEEDIRVHLNKETYEAQYERPHQAFAQYFQLDFYSTTARDKFDMTRQWSAAHRRPDYWNMPVIDAAGNNRTVPVHLIQSKTNDKLEKDNNLYRDTKIYRIRVEIDEGTRYTIHVLEKVNIHLHPGGVED